MADEELDGPDMVGELLGEGQRLAYQPGHTLAQRILKAFDVIGFRANLLIARCCAAGITPSYTTY